MRHNYRVIVSDLDRERPIWVGGEGRKEADIDLFFNSVGREKECPHRAGGDGYVEGVLRNSVMKNAPNARIIYDKFRGDHCAISQRPSMKSGAVSTTRLSGKDRSYIKGAAIYLALTHART